MSATDLLRTVVAAFDEAGIQHMLVGSFASMSHGAPRATQDIDVVIDPTREALTHFVGMFDRERYYIGPTPEDALARRDQFNLIDVATGWKVDLIIRKDRPFSRSEFARRLPARVLDVDVHLATAEDTVLAKLEWAKAGGSSRQIDDAARVLAVRGGDLDEAYLDQWGDELGVLDLLAEARRA